MTAAGAKVQVKTWLSDLAVYTERQKRGMDRRMTKVGGYQESTKHGQHTRRAAQLAGRYRGMAAVESIEMLAAEVSQKPVSGGEPWVGE